MNTGAQILSLFRSLDAGQRAEFVARLTPEQALAIKYDWRLRARPEQLAPGSEGAADGRRDWAFWLLLAGRGVGKTRSGAEWCIEKARDIPGSHGALVAATSDDARKVMLSAGLETIEGASGILAISSPSFKPVYEPSKRTVTWPNGSVATLYSAEEPNRLRGPQHHWGWADEIAAWEKEAEAWNQFLFGLRLGKHPQACITSTPRPIKIVRDLLKNAQTVVSRGSTYDNRANLADGFFQQIVAQYEGTRIGRQELHGELLEDNPGALWNASAIDATRVVKAPEMRRVVVAIDPAVSNHEGSDETGIVVFGVGVCACRGAEELHGFVLADLSGKESPSGWARTAIEAFHKHGADRVVAEVNNGGNLVEENLRTLDRNIAFTAVHASRGKRARAEPVSALYEQGKVHHVGAFPKLEDQMCGWEPLGNQRSPDRVDALVWAAHETMLQEEETSADRYMRTEW